MKICHACKQTYSDDVEFCPRDGSRLAAQATEIEAQLAATLSRRFRLVRRLGAGGMGTVFLAEQIGVGNRPVALKVLNRKLLDDPDFLLRFQDEAGSTGRIHHPNVVTIYESGQADDGTPYIAMEHLEGESLRQALERRGEFPVTEVAEILQQTARGLNAAHKLGIIHRDLKPDNIFLTRDDEGDTVVKVLDFGIAKLRESAMHTQTGMALGTPAYMSFEQASGMRSDELDARSDIYSLGVVTYEMVTGRLPFQSDTPVGYLRKHLQDVPPLFRSVTLGLSIPPQVEAVVMKALKKEREERYQSALEFAHAFVAAVLPAPAADVSQPLPSTRVVVSPAVRGFDAPVPSLRSRPPQAENAVQTPSHAPPKRIIETPTAQPQESKPAAEDSSPPAMAKPPQLRTISKPPAKMKFVIIAGVVLILIVAGVWYFSSRPGTKNLSDSKNVPGVPSQSEQQSLPVSTLTAKSANGQPSESENAVRDAVGAWVQAFRSKDSTALADSYAPLVETYFRRTNVSHEQISQNIESTFARMVKIRKYEVNDLRVEMLSGDNSSNGIAYNRATATFRKTWDALESDGKSFSGEEIEQLTFTSSPQGWKIIREEELKILRASRH